VGRTELARAFALALQRAGLAGPGCTRCGGLHHRSRSATYVLHGTKAPTCAACGLTLDHRGRPIGRRQRDGSVAHNVYELPTLPLHLMSP